MLSSILHYLDEYLPRRQQLLGLTVVLIGSLFSMWLNNALQEWTDGHLLGLSALTLAIVIGMILGNSLYPRLAPRLHEGVSFAKGQILRLAIIFYGFKLTLTQVASVGMPAIICDALVLISTFLLTYWLGVYLLKVDRKTTLLIGSGASICGAAAVIAAEPVIEAESHKVTIAVATVVVFGTLAMILYPVLYHTGWLLQWLNPQQYGIYTGSSIHEVAQVVVAGNAINTDVGNTAVVTKMIRVMMLAPFLLVLSFVLTPKADNQATTKSTHTLLNRLTHVKVPWFAFIFIVVVILHTLFAAPESFISAMITIDNILLTMAMFALGLTTHMSAIKHAGIRPLLLGAIMFGWLIIGGGMINVLVSQLW
ncbi:YeiH family protein [Psychrobacter sp. I-STPA10]|uniref:YeiH family protein n=1 Tax=Psychrobacter sp. I-STPA10 TaxID=2585769 RepID=UPI001E492328|nr:YeiH family protein [Psychrobacter sp. I-STPA10]